MTNIPTDNEGLRRQVKKCFSDTYMETQGDTELFDTEETISNMVALLQAAHQQGIEEAVIQMMTPKTEGLFDNGELFVKRAPVEQVWIDLVGYERYKAIQESLPAINTLKAKGEREL